MLYLSNPQASSHFSGHYFGHPPQQVFPFIHAVTSSLSKGHVKGHVQIQQSYSGGIQGVYPIPTAKCGYPRGVSKSICHSILSPIQGTMVSKYRAAISPEYSQMWSKNKIKIKVYRGHFRKKKKLLQSGFS